MELSKLPKDVWGLGLHLVRELGLEKGDDILGRWMAHHLAELMNEAETGKTEATRSKARKDATETIIKIWKHRASLPGNVYPLAPYKDLLQVLEQLQPSRNSFSNFGRTSISKKDQIVKSLLESINRLSIVISLIKIPAENRLSNVDPTVTQALDQDEELLLNSIQRLSIFLNTQRNNRKSKKNKDEASSDGNLNDVVIDLVDEIDDTLEELRNELKNNGL